MRHHTQFVLVTLIGHSQHQSQLQTSGWLVSGSPGFNDDFLESPFSILSLESPEHHLLPELYPLAWSLDGGGEAEDWSSSQCYRTWCFQIVLSAAAALQENPLLPISCLC